MGTRLSCVALFFAAVVSGCDDTGDRPIDSNVPTVERGESRLMDSRRGSIASAIEPRAPSRGENELATAETKRGFELVATGDILVHIRVREAAAARTEGMKRVFRSLAHLIPDEALAFANLETPLVDDREPVRTGDPPILGASPEVAAAMAAAGLDVVSVANNHAWDQGADGLADTIRTLDGVGIEVVGAAHDEGDLLRPLVIRRGGVRVGWLAVTDHVNRRPGSWPPETHVPILRWMESERLLEAVRSARREVDVLVAYVHWGDDFVAEPPSEIVALFDSLVEHGADLVIGSGPHVLHRVERRTSPRGQALVAFSLGNLVSNQGKRYRIGRGIPRAHHAVLDPRARDGVLLRVTIELNDQGRVELPIVEGTPLFTHNNFWQVERGLEQALDIRIEPLTAHGPSLREERRPIIQATLGPAVHLPR